MAEGTPKHLAEEMAEGRLLAAVGLSEVEERAYVLLVGSPPLTAAEVAERLGMSLRRAQIVLRALQLQGLASRSLSRPPRYLAAPPEVMLPALVLRSQEELQQVRLAAGRLAELARRAPARGKSRPELLELLSGSAAVGACFDQLQRAAEQEVCALDRPPYRVGGPANPAEFAALARGVAYRAIYDPTALTGPGQPDTLRRFVAAGEQARVFPDLPTKMVVVDSRTALIPLDPRDPGGDSLVIRAPAVVETLLLLFETLWRQATPLAAALTEATGPGRAIRVRDTQGLVALLAAGMTDEAIARQFGVAPRTLDRRVADLMRTLGAHTRFQAGWRAALRFHPLVPSDDNRPTNPRSAGLPSPAQGGVAGDAG